MNILVTACWIHSSRLVDILLENGHCVICLDNFDPYYDLKIKRNNIKHNLAKRILNWLRLT